MVLELSELLLFLSNSESVKPMEYNMFRILWPLLVTSILYKKKTPWSESASELYLSSDRRLSAK
jgi:hypothetical protein